MVGIADTVFIREMFFIESFHCRCNFLRSLSQINSEEIPSLSDTPTCRLQVIHLVMFHLLLDGHGRKSYLHYANDIGAFLKSNWDRVLPYRKQTPSWISTIAGVLSTHCPSVFKSGTEELKEGGWWSLSSIQPPDPPVGCIVGERNIQYTHQCTVWARWGTCTLYPVEGVSDEWYSVQQAAACLHKAPYLE